MSANVTVLVRNVSKSFFVGKRGSDRSIFQRKDRRKIEAIKDVSFVAYAGESIGILGRNGSGKSTLLNMIAGHENPTTGEILVSSEPTILGVSAALQPNLSGGDNAKMGLLAMGLSSEEVIRLQPDVIEWAELQEHQDLPMRTYSSGMKSRLKFAIATAVRREILMVDEALSTGDSTFAAKAKARMDEFLKEAGTVFIVSHAPGTIEKYCSRAIWLHNGEIIADGDTKSVTRAYRIWSKREASRIRNDAQEIIDDTRKKYTPKTFLLDSEAAHFLDEIGRTSDPESKMFNQKR